MNTKDLIAKISVLPIEQRIEIIDQILQTLKNPDPTIESEWFRIVSARLEEYKEGKVHLIPAEEVFDTLRDISDE